MARAKTIKQHKATKMSCFQKYAALWLVNATGGHGQQVGIVFSCKLTGGTVASYFGSFMFCFFVPL